jgi:hypothetical protein
VVNFLIRAQKSLLGVLSGAEFLTGTLDIETALSLAKYLADEPAYDRDFCDFISRRVPA